MNEIISNFKDIVLNKYAKFDGKADRAEFWRFFLAMVSSASCSPCSRRLSFCIPSLL